MGKLIDAVTSNNLKEVEKLLARSGFIGGYKNSPDLIIAEDALAVAAKCGFVDIIQALLKAGAEVNKARGAYKYDKTPLYAAASSGHATAIEVLVKAGADVNQIDKDGRTPLYSAAREGHATAIEALVKAGADVNQANKDGVTPLYVAAQNGHLAAIEALVKAKANVNQAAKDGVTPLLMAALQGHTTAIEALVKAGADVNQAAKDGHTPLYWAAWNGHVAAIEALVKAGADVNQAAKDDWTPLFGAAFNGHAAAIEVLLKAVVKVNQKSTNNNLLNQQRAVENNNSGPQQRVVADWGPLRIAKHKGHTEAVRLLETHIQRLEQQEALKREAEKIRLAEVQRKQQEEKARQEQLETQRKQQEEEEKYIQTKEVASRGNSNAQFQLGMLYEKGQGTDKNITMALEWYQKSAEQSHIKAFKRLEEIATEGNASVQFKLGLMYEEGQGIVQNNDKAVEWYKKAVEQGHVDALERFKGMATKGNTIAQSTLGLIYEDGRNVSQDLKLAFQWFDKAGDVNNMERVAQRLLTIENARTLASPKTASSNQPVVYRREGLETEEKQVENAQPIIPSHLVKKEGKINVGNSFTLKYHELEIGKELGRGAFGIVYQGTWKKHIEVAVKQLILTKPSPDALTEFQQEMNLMNNLRCPQIVQLYGVYTEPSYGIVMAYMPNGSLYSVLHSNKPLEWDVRYSIAVDITKGVAFLHSENILHRDLKSLNVLLDKHMNAKLTDFGLAKIKTETASTSSSNNNQVAGTLLWMAPELFKRRAQCTQKSDMYSLGMTLWELASRETPFKDATNQTIAKEWILEGEREDIPIDTPPKVSKLITFCWNADAAKRPTADEAVKQLISAELKQEQTESANFSYRGNVDSGIK